MVQLTAIIVRKLHKDTSIAGMQLPINIKTCSNLFVKH